MRGEDNGGRRHALVAGGRTGGHVFPGLALAEELERRGWRVSFVGMAGQLEERAASAQGLAFHSLPAAPLVGATMVSRLAALVRVVVSAISGLFLVRRERADAVVGLGGYVSVPAVLGGWLARRPILLFEPNATVGVANRGLSRFADEAALTHADAAGTMRCPTTVTGTPVRTEFFEQPEYVAGQRGDRRRILILGGSQGASWLNEVVPAALAALGAGVSHFEVVHQCGPERVAAARAAYAASPAAPASLDLVPFLDDMASAMGAADLIVSRAGAITLAEICAVGRASVLIPLELAGAHQADNAKALAASGAAECLDSRVGPNELGRLLQTLMETPERLTSMARAARAQGRPDAVERLADRVERLVES